MLRYLTLRQISVFIVLLLAIAGSGILLSFLYINAEVGTVATTWTEFKVVRSEKARLGGQLRSALGYGGMIHNYKNYILRGGDYLRENTRAQIGGVEMVLEQYGGLPLNGTERAALENIQATIIAYQNALDVVEGMKLADESGAKTDVVVKIDDGLALRGLETLRIESIPKDSAPPVSRARLILQIQALLGYGGMIHNVKNYVLRAQDEYYENAMANIAAIKTVVTQYRDFPLTLGEQNALDDVLGMLDAYAAALDTIRARIDAGYALENLDVMVEDGPALRALAALKQEANLEILMRSLAMDASLSKIVTVGQAVTVIETLFILGIAVLLMWVLRKQILSPLKRMNADMKRIAVGEYDVVIPDPAGHNEIAAMTRNLQVLLKNSIVRRKVEQRLGETNEELNQQLLEIQNLRELAEEQAAQAVGMAETLALAKEESEVSKVRALADERRTRTIMNTVTDAIITINAKGLIETFNQAAQVMFGYAQEEVVGRNVSFLMPEPVRSAHDGYLATFLEGRAARIAGKTVEQVALRKDTTTFPIDLSVNPMYLGNEISFIGVIRDITERKAAEEEIHRLALTDGLTGLANRNAFSTKFKEAITQAQRRKTHVALMMIDLDKFKPVNDQYGHPVGDALLVAVADSLRTICRETDIVARLGGDEFAAILTDLDDLDHVHLPAQKIIDVLSRPMQVLNETVQIGASIGIAFFPDDTDNREHLVTLADDALYAAKAAGRNTYRVHGKPDVAPAIVR